ncbi:hypothetical protein [Roseovarius sp. 2305UL8-3]|uniref:hypothetical protein n=1 Tax=Roseovarius conchicola TaxID=3121636 RepID=UPI0035282FD1
MYASSNAHKSVDSETAHRLRNAMERLTTPRETFRDESKVASPDFKELVQCLVREIDETVLPRRLALFSGGHAIATMIASNRRLLELEIDGRKIGTDLGQDASPETVASAYAQALKALSARSGPLVLRMIDRAPQAATGSLACSARHLTEFSETPYFKNRLRAFLKEIHAATQGWIFRTGNGETIAHDPDQEVFKRLTLLEQKVSSEAACRNGHRRLDRPNRQCVAFFISDDVQAMVVSDGNDLLIAALPNPDTRRAMEQWTAIYGRDKSDLAP